MATCVLASVPARMVQFVIMLLGTVHVHLDTMEQLVTQVRNSILTIMLIFMMSCLSDRQFVISVVRCLI